MKNLLALSILILSTQLLAANSDGSGTTPESIYQHCTLLLDANSDGSGTLDANSDGSGTEEANSDGSGTTEANSDGSGTYAELLSQCVADNS